MALDSALQELYVRLRTLTERLVEVSTTVREDRPASGDTVLADIFGDTIDEGVGWLAEAQDAALAAEQALQDGARFSSVRSCVSTLHRRVLQANEVIVNGLLQYERLSALQRVGRERGPEWRAWARSVKHGLDGCQSPLRELHESVLESWLELTERTVEPNVQHESASMRQGGG